MLEPSSSEEEDDDVVSYIIIILYIHYINYIRLRFGSIEEKRIVLGGHGRVRASEPDLLKGQCHKK